MIVRETRGRSFKGAVAYLVHDKEAETSERLLWARTLNLPTNDPEKAAKVMAWTALNQNVLKQLAGESTRGRKAQNPVVHFSLNWSPDESVTPDHMAQAAREFLAHMGMEKHQAILTAHGDTRHQHVHLLVNAVDHETGKMHKLKYTKETASRWAEAYERQRGAILCKNREFNNAARDEGRKVIDFESRRRERAYQAYLKQLEIDARADRENPDAERYRAREFEWTPTERDYRAAAADRARDRGEAPALTEAFNQAKPKATEAANFLKEARARAWQALKTRQKAERDGLWATTQGQIKATAKSIREVWKPRLEELRKEERQALRFIQNQAAPIDTTRPPKRRSVVVRFVRSLATHFRTAAGGPGAESRAAFAELRSQLNAERSAALDHAVKPIREKGEIDRILLKERQKAERDAHFDETKQLWAAHWKTYRGEPREKKPTPDLTNAFQRKAVGIELAKTFRDSAEGRNARQDRPKRPRESEFSSAFREGGGKPYRAIDDLASDFRPSAEDRGSQGRGSGGRGQETRRLDPNPFAKFTTREAPASDPPEEASPPAPQDRDLDLPSAFQEARGNEHRAEPPSEFQTQADSESGPAPEGRGTSGRGSEGRGSEGRGTGGRGTESRGSEGGSSEGGRDFSR